MRRRGVSPMSGCLPQFIPLPIMMGLYYAVQQPLQYIVGLSRETVIALAQMIGLDQLAGANYTVQIRDRREAERISWMQPAISRPTLCNCLQSGETIFPLDFHFFGLNLADTPSISHPSIIWIIPILSGLTAFLSSYIMQKMQGTQNSAAAGQMKMLNFTDAADVAVLCVHPSGRDRHLLDLQQRIHLRTGDHPHQDASAASRRPEQAAEAARIEAEKQAKREAHNALHRSSSPRTQRTKRGTSKSCRSF